MNGSRHSKFAFRLSTPNDEGDIELLKENILNMLGRPRYVHLEIKPKVNFSGVAKWPWESGQKINDSWWCPGQSDEGINPDVISIAKHTTPQLFLHDTKEFRMPSLYVNKNPVRNNLLN